MSPVFRLHFANDIHSAVSITSNCYIISNQQTGIVGLFQQQYGILLA